MRLKKSGTEARRALPTHTHTHTHAPQTPTLPTPVFLAPVSTDDPSSGKQHPGRFASSDARQGKGTGLGAPWQFSFIVPLNLSLAVLGKRFFVSSRVAVAGARGAPLSLHGHSSKTKLSRKICGKTQLLAIGGKRGRCQRCPLPSALRNFLCLQTKRGFPGCPSLPSIIFKRKSLTFLNQNSVHLPTRRQS